MENLSRLHAHVAGILLARHLQKTNGNKPNDTCKQTIHRHGHRMIHTRTRTPTQKNSMQIRTRNICTCSTCCVQYTHCVLSIHSAQTHAKHTFVQHHVRMQLHHMPCSTHIAQSAYTQHTRKCCARACCAR